MSDQTGILTAPKTPRRQRNERFAQVLAYLSPYIFWGTVCTLTGSIWLLQ